MEKAKPNLKKNNKTKKIDKQFEGHHRHTHLQGPSTATFMVLTTWCNIPTDFTSGVFPSSPVVFSLLSPNFVMADSLCRSLNSCSLEPKIHKPMNTGESTKHNRAGVVLKEKKSNSK
jgi:hypothetical protein